MSDSGSGAVGKTVRMMAARHTKFVHRVRLSWMACAFGIVAVTMLAYVPALRGGFVWDDDAYVTENRSLKTAGGLKAIWLYHKVF